MAAPRLCLTSLLACAALLPLGGCGEGSVPSPLATLRRPKAIVLISLDTLRADMLGAYGYRRYPTSPFLDSFAEENILFENAIVQEPRTLTSHMSLMTGLYPHHHAVVDETVLEEDVPTLASLLRERGFRTQGFADGGYLDAKWGFDRGFDGYADERVGGEEIFAQAKRWLRAHGGEPFFLFLHTYEIHSEGIGPYYPSPPPYAGMFSGDMESVLRASSMEEFGERWEAHADDLTDADHEYVKATYAEGIRHTDAIVADFFEFLERRNMIDDVLVVIWSDHGEGLFDHGGWSHGQLYDHTLRVPLFLRLPGWEAGSLRVKSVVSSIDIAPTILQLVGGPVPPRMDGVSLLPLLQQEEEGRSAFSVRTKGDMRRFSLRAREKHYLWDDESREGLYFDLRSDREERKNLIEVDPDAGSLRPRLEAWIEVWSQAREGRGTETRALDDETLEELRALGYVE